MLPQQPLYVLALGPDGDLAPPQISVFAARQLYVWREERSVLDGPAHGAALAAGKTEVVRSISSKPLGAGVDRQAGNRRL